MSGWLPATDLGWSASLLLLPRQMPIRTSVPTQINVTQTYGPPRHMGDFTQPQQKYAGTGENYNFAIAVIFYPGIKDS